MMNSRVVVEKWESMSHYDAQNPRVAEKWESMSRFDAQNPRVAEKWESMSRFDAQNPRVAEKWESMSRFDSQNPKRRPNALMVPRKVLPKSEFLDKTFIFVGKTNIFVKTALRKGKIERCFATSGNGD
ncbi:hypothetical protein [Bacillus sp. 1NLA3E]|uniref:hypothetical protein n=1 Tax=Bacillus sp. 1NLA3E TaxID=666686 RepID=UPI0011819224|nr:hypothetical protein [Bacillus sp. 1NLA3E]